MMRAKARLRRLFCHSLPLTVLIGVLAFAFLVVVLSEGIDGPAAYFVYLISSYGLAVTITGLVRLTATIRRRVARIPLAARLAGDISFAPGCPCGSDLQQTCCM